ncbi:MAG TPA: NAD-dependent epimerase/dehydratase family protein [Dokdonella sp.]|uniref:NAD-dependent epimerase/dehydratase family protein n=1 Tax=Dokdonella sp. TaxID=2291710 RepID=UPI002B70203F|nr:NAD-dependent epimerase/dehydratase family protein [Dokdonella sp.]HOX72954.1 NAD-dependent epimerase/dehydratase family protein [Dokdonella sp.]HPG95618.1 NAD-dependent epimerase/dehydratase family protein [Dokdonella sp.]HPN79888.1 NAD-dependent epimerase/dehydratase family protein [Dokdonella sp.]
MPNPPNDPLREGAGSVLVLGSAGFIGSPLCRQLARLGYAVHALGRSERTESSAGITRIRGSIEDRRLLREALAACATVVYAAATTTPGTSAGDPSLEVIGNLLPLSRLLECAADFPQRRIVYLSSGGTIYGDDASGAVESRVLRPRSYYGAGKVAAEALLHACVSTSDWTAVSLRPSNLYGPGQRVTRGFAIVPTLFDRAADGEEFQIWGDGSTVRDYCYLDDLIDAIVLALPVPAADPFTVYNVASGQTASILELIGACELASGRKIRVRHLPARGFDVACVSPSHRAITEDLGWKARTDLATGLQRTWDWRQQPADLSSH